MSLNFRAAAFALPLASIAAVAAAQPQDAGAPPRQPASAVASTASAAASKPLSYRSAFEGYRPFIDQAVQPWREANDLVARIGGWQSYAREGQGSPAAAGAVAPAGLEAMQPGAPGAPNAPAMPASAPRGHSGHKPS